MRIRTIKPEFWTDPFMVSIPHLARLIYISLFGVADDFGYIEDEPERVAMLVMPLEDPMDVFDWLDFFVASERLEVMVSDDGTRSLRLINFQKHQKVDRPTKSKIAREGSRKLAIPFATRRGVAEKYFCPPGESVTAECFYCGAEGRIHWHKLRSGKPSSWISFAALELDHHEPESAGGLGSTGNIVLACRRCNRSKGSQHWAPFITSKNPGLILDASREDSRILAPERKGKEQGMEGNGKDPLSVLTDEIYPEIIETIWLIFPPTSRNRSSKKKITEAWAKTRPKPDGEALVQSLTAWAASHEWTKDGGQFAPGAHIWIKDRKWEAEPMAAPYRHKHAGIGANNFTGDEF